MYDDREDDQRQARDLVAVAYPPIRLAGTEDDDWTEPHIVRGID